VTNRELRLRRRIDYLSDRLEESELTIRELRKKLKGSFGHCRWCGGWAWGPACSLHVDLERMERQLYG